MTERPQKTRRPELAAALVLALVTACSSSSSSPSSDAGAAAGPPGTAVLTFSIDPSTRKAKELTDPLVGTVYGGIYLAEDVSATGPRDGAVQYGDVTVANVDLRTADVSAASFTTQGLAPNTYVFIGFFDVDGNGATTQRPDPGDPVTVPTMDKRFDIVSGQEIKKTETFDLIDF